MKVSSFLPIVLCFVIVGCAGNTNIPETLNRVSKSENVSHIRDTPENINGLAKRRNKNKALMEYISDRTVYIKRDCSPKKGVVVVGTSNPNKRYDSSGSGVIVRSTKKGSIIFTVDHVAQIDSHLRDNFNCDLSIYKYKYPGVGSGYKATLVRFDSTKDLAILYTEKNLGLNTALELQAFTGEDVWAAGFPYLFGSRDDAISITKGTIATKNVNIGSGGKYHRITSQIYFGNSGGGVWTKEGKLVGVAAIFFGVRGSGNKTQPYEGYYYAKPANDFLDLLE